MKAAQPSGYFARFVDMAQGGLVAGAAIWQCIKAQFAHKAKIPRRGRVGAKVGVQKIGPHKAAGCLHRQKSTFAAGQGVAFGRLHYGGKHAAAAQVYVASNHFPGAGGKTTASGFRARSSPRRLVRG